MKTAKPPAAEAGPSSSRRAQPVRQTRANPPRTSSGPSRTFGARDSLGGGSGHEQPIDIFPAITHFTDAISSLPKDLVRHFTLLKEVDAKIFAPEETLFQLVDAAIKSNPPEPRLANDASSSIAPSTPMSAQNSSSGFAARGNLPPGSIDENQNSAVYDPGNMPRRQLFRQTAFRIQEMLVSLEEKNHVITTANEALSKQLNRISTVWPHLEGEFSDEAKWGSTTHWAYPENRANRANQAERSRRDGAATITAAAQQLADEAAARSDARKQAIIAKKGLKNQQQHQDSDLDDHDNNNSTKQKGESSKKASGGSKARKVAEAAAPVGLGITAGTTANGNPPSKRRKVENNKTVNGGQPMERAMSSVFGSTATKTKNSSPRATPAPEPTKKRKALPTANGISKKSKTALAAAALSPSTVSSPVQATFADPKTTARTSPAPSANASRPASSRARQNSIQSNVENGRQRPASSASNKPNGIAIVAPEIAAIPRGPRQTTEPKAPKEPAIAAIKTETSKEEPKRSPPITTNASGSSKKEGAAKGDESEAKGDTGPAVQPTATTVVTTKSGRASKPSTPALGNFPDSAPRSRSARNTMSTTTTKRSHKKGAAQQAIAARLADEDANSSAQGDEEGDVDELRYCYCHGVSYGEMVACDAEDCPREWFHLDCVGLKAAPPSNVKWYCDHCKDRLKPGKKVNGR
ncbi:Uu.00g063870.m01.CDS01 [Anthostomella pinea]|uniref:Chromatin modification-related protein n=1 Tax=Anthostomella pinea TaxID=933095 RepID=A0AAI8VTF2_9PEZI|nr:Uu.00g063870.m01.CDS01 [Anthostomella pinea]